MSEETTGITELWEEGVAPEEADDAKDLAAMSDQELDAELEEELGPIHRWMQENTAAAEFANDLYPDLIDIDEARQELPE